MKKFHGNFYKIRRNTEAVVKTESSRPVCKSITYHIYIFFFEISYCDCYLRLFKRNLSQSLLLGDVNYIQRKIDDSSKFSKTTRGFVFMQIESFGSAGL